MAEQLGNWLDTCGVCGTTHPRDFTWNAAKGRFTATCSVAHRPVELLVGRGNAQPVIREHDSAQPDPPGPPPWVPPPNPGHHP